MAFLVAVFTSSGATPLLSGDVISTAGPLSPPAVPPTAPGVEPEEAKLLSVAFSAGMFLPVLSSLSMVRSCSCPKRGPLGSSP